MKKILALVLTLAMMLTMLNVGFIASAESEIPEGAIAISTAEQLAAMEAGKYYYLTADNAEADAKLLTEMYGIDMIAGLEGEAPVVKATPAIRAYQMSLDGSAIRVLATVDSSKYENIGFTYSALVNDEIKAIEKTVTSNYVMKAVNAVTGVTGPDPDTGDPIDGDVLVTMTAEEIGGQYVTAITFRNVPAEGYAIITVAPTAGEYVGMAYTIVIMDGVVVSCTAAA